MVYFGFAMSDSMFNGNVTVRRSVLTPEIAKNIIDKATACVNPSHQATIDAASQRFGIKVEIPETPPKVLLEKGDLLIVMAVQGLPRLTDRHEYNQDEIAAASFLFSEWNVQ